MKTRVLLLLCRFWRTKQLVIFHKLIVTKIKKADQYIDSTRHILTIDLFQDNRHRAGRRLHRTNDPHMLSSLQTTHIPSQIQVLSCTKPASILNFSDSGVRSVMEKEPYHILLTVAYLPDRPLMKKTAAVMPNKALRIINALMGTP